MRYEYIIEIKGKIKSRDLYEKIAKYNANVTDIIFMTLVYGEADLNGLISIILTCLKYGKHSGIKVHFKRCK